MFLGALSFFGLLYNRGWVEDRLRSWGMLLDSSSFLCRNDVETLITISLSNALNPYPFGRVWCPETWFEACLGKWWTFQNGSAWMSRARASKVLVFSCSLAATVYSLWRERNPRVFQGKSTEQSQLLLRIFNEVWDFLSSRRKMKPSLEENRNFLWPMGSVRRF